MAATIFVTMGRNVTCTNGSFAMADSIWRGFKSDVAEIFLRSPYVLVQRPLLHLSSQDQFGTWDQEGEQACTFVALYTGTHSAAFVRLALTDPLARLARYYKQQAVGLVVVEGDDHLVYAGE